MIDVGWVLVADGPDARDLLDGKRRGGFDGVGLAFFDGLFLLAWQGTNEAERGPPLFFSGCEERGDRVGTGRAPRGD